MLWGKERRWLGSTNSPLATNYICGWSMSYTEIMQNDLILSFIMLARFPFLLAHLKALKSREERKILASSFYVLFVVCFLFCFGFYLWMLYLMKWDLIFASQVWCKPQSLPAQRPFDPHEPGVFFSGWFVDGAFSSEGREWQWAKETSLVFIHLNCALLLRVQDCKQLRLLDWRKPWFSSQCK